MISQRGLNYSNKKNLSCCLNQISIYLSIYLNKKLTVTNEMFDCLHEISLSVSTAMLLNSYLSADLVPGLGRVLKLSCRHCETENSLLPIKRKERFSCRVDGLLQLCASRLCNIQLELSFPLKLPQFILQSERWKSRVTLTKMQSPGLLWRIQIENCLPHGLNS